MSDETIIPYKRFVGSVVPNFLMTKKKLSQGAKLCYGRLAQHAGKNGAAFPRQKKLGEELGVSSRTIRKYLEELRNVGLIKVTQRGKTRSNSYVFLKHPWMLEDERYLQSVRKKSSEQGGRLLPDTEDYPSSKERKKSSDPSKEIHLKQSKEIEPPNETVYGDDDFEKIFNAYPKKIAKASALKAIKGALDDIKDRESIDEPVSWLLSKVKLFAKSKEQISQRYIPHPQKWFWEKRYDDDPSEWIDDQSNSKATLCQSTFSTQDVKNVESLLETNFAARDEANNITVDPSIIEELYQHVGIQE